MVSTGSVDERNLGVRKKEVSRFMVEGDSDRVGVSEIRASGMRDLADAQGSRNRLILLQHRYANPAATAPHPLGIYYPGLLR